MNDFLSGLLGLQADSADCESPDCAKRGIRLPGNSLLYCTCGCDKRMCQPCVVKHNLQLVQALKLWKAAQS